MNLFPPTRSAALARIAAIEPVAYARSRNAIDGAVSCLSPYLTHGIVSSAEVVAGIAARHTITHQHQFIYELGWREYFRHVWARRGDQILESLHAGPLPETAYEGNVPADIREGRSGVPVIDQAVRTLYATGYLHNHARMWLASYIVHIRHVHWRAGADWMIAHLLDGDLASNHLSWQWVAGTGSGKPYVFNADNVAKYAPPSWHSFGSVLDTSYAALLRLANGVPAPAPMAQGQGIPEPTLLAAPMAGMASAPPTTPAMMAGRDVWLVHPWGLGEPPADLPPDCISIGWWPAEHHANWPWGALRWQFAHGRMQALTSVAWHASTDELAAALAGARSVQTWADPHVVAHLPTRIQQRETSALFATVPQPCSSFSQWWRRSMRGVQTLRDLPGIAALDR